MRPSLAILLMLALAAAARAAAPDHAALCARLADTERAFCARVAAEGITDAFLDYMAPEVFLPDTLELGRAEHEARVKAARAKPGAGPAARPDPNVQLTWAPLRVDVSDDGTLGYTWGRYDYTAKDAAGKASTTTGIYLTIWRRQPDGGWKFVFDGGPEIPADPAALRAFLARADLPRPAP